MQIRPIILIWRSSLNQVRETCSWQPLVFIIILYKIWQQCLILHALFKPQKMKAIFFLYLYVQNFWTNVIGLGNFSSPDLKVSIINVYCPLIKKTFPSKTTGSIKIQISCISYGLWNKTWQKWSKKCQFPKFECFIFH